MKIVELKSVSKNKIGRVNLNGARLEAHEYETIYLLTSFGIDVDVILPRNTPKVNNPDFMLLGAIWEAKSPEGKSEKCIERKMHEAGKQADRVVFDLRRVKIPAEKAQEKTIKEFGHSRRIRRMLLIRKDGKLLDIKK